VTPPSSRVPSLALVDVVVMICGGARFWSDHGRDPKKSEDKGLYKWLERVRRGYKLLNGTRGEAGRGPGMITHANVKV
jgi:hypothetical protein